MRQIMRTSHMMRSYS